MIHDKDKEAELQQLRDKFKNNIDQSINKRNNHKSQPFEKVNPNSDKYWIKTGIAVVHKDYLAENIKMTVENIVKKSSLDKDGISRPFIVGVRTHWFKANGDYFTGMFMTTELMLYREDGQYEILEKIKS